MYAQSYNTWYKRLGVKFLEAIDISENLVRTTQAVASIPNGWISLILAPVAFVVALSWAAGAYYFDFYSSWTAMTPYRERVLEVAAGLAAVGVFLAWLVQVLPFSLTVLPTFTEMLGSRFARFGIPAVQGAVWFFVIFDAATDIPHVSEFMEMFKVHFYNVDAGFWGIALNPRQLIGFFAYGITWTLALLAASYFLELLTLIFVWAGIGLLWKSIGFWVLGWLAGREAKANWNVDADDDFARARPRKA